MVRRIQRNGEFAVKKYEYLNFYYELTYKGTPYAYIHTQLAVAEKFAHCHAYVKRFSAEIAREMMRDWVKVKDNMRVFDIETVVGTKVDGIKVWEKFIKLLGFEDISPSIMENKPCMLAVMEL